MNQEVTTPLIPASPAGGLTGPSPSAAPQVHVVVNNQVLSEEYRLKIVLLTQWAVVISLLTLLVTNILVAPPWHFTAKCDPVQTSWSFIWISMMLVHMGVLLAISHCRFAGRLAPTPLYHAQRLLRLLNLVWFCSGVKPLFWDMPCDSAASLMGRILWWTQASCFLLPLCCYVSLCLSFPCLLLLLRHLRQPSPNETPTPHSVLNKLEVRKYDELLETLRAEYGNQVDFLPPGTQTLSDVVRQNPVVEALTTAASAAMGVSRLGSSDAPMRRGVSDSGTGSDDGSQPQQQQRIDQLQFERWVVGRSCPVCLAEFESRDTVMLMPCDKRHFFHIDCAVRWLKISQFCPICRSNIVTLTNTQNTSDAQSPSNNSTSINRPPHRVPASPRNSTIQEQQQCIEFVAASSRPEGVANLPSSSFPPSIV